MLILRPSSFCCPAFNHKKENYNFIEITQCSGQTVDIIAKFQQDVDVSAATHYFYTQLFFLLIIKFLEFFVVGLFSYFCFASADKNLAAVGGVLTRLNDEHCCVWADRGRRVAETAGSVVLSVLHICGLVLLVKGNRTL